MVITFRFLLLALMIALDCSHGVAATTDKSSGSLTGKDALTTPGQSVRIEARLVHSSLLGDVGLGGEPLELLIGGKPVATAMTGGDGRAFFDYLPKIRGTYEFTVRLGTTSRVTATETTGSLAVWEKRRPVLMVEMAALLEETGSAPLPLPSLPAVGGAQGQVKPALGAADELSRLTQFYYNVIYVSWSGAEGASFHGDDSIRQWLKEYKFPTGFVVAVKPGANALGTVLDEFKKEGWTTLKIGIARSRAFAEVLLEHRLEAILVPEPAQGEVPRKAKVAKDWKDVRKKL